jgi:lipopolysaccharide export LptBFGC system permease protein LptF
LDQVVERSLLAALLASMLWCCFAVVAIYLTHRAVRSRQWPPAGISVPFRTEVIDIKRPWVAWALLAVFVVTCAFQIAGPWYGYATLREVTPALKRALAKQPNSLLQPTGGDMAPSSAAERKR